MRFREFKPLQEGNKSDSVRYNSEVGMLAAFCNVDISTFDPNNPQATFPAETLANPENTYRDIVKYLAPVYDVPTFTKFYNIGLKYQPRILQELETLGEPAPTTYDWSGGSNINPEGAADVIFGQHPTMHGISIKAESGITLRNLTASSVGLSEGEDVIEHPDVFARYAEPEWIALKQYGISKVLEIARKQPGQPYHPIKPKYQIIYESGQLAVEPAKNKGLTPGVKNKIAKLAVGKEPMGQDPEPLAENVQGYFRMFDGDKWTELTEQQIYGASNRNASWQRVFGDHVQSHWNKDSQIKMLADKLFSSISEIFVEKIKTALLVKERLHKLLAMGKKGYFYATPKQLYFVPGVEQVDNLVLKDVIYGAPKGSAQKFFASIGMEGGDNNATVLVYVRYANGMFDANPTVRIQDLKNPGALAWTKLL